MCSPVVACDLESKWPQQSPHNASEEVAGESYDSDKRFQISQPDQKAHASLKGFDRAS